jgi:acetyl esterase
VYRPAESARTPAVALYFHGGGWVAGDLDTHDALCRQIVHYSDTTLVAVDYPLAPEHPFPAALDVALGAHEWLRANLTTVDLDDDTPIAVVGDSAGANLAVALTLAILNSDQPDHAPAAVIATHPVLQPGKDSWSRQQYGRGFGLTTRRLEALWAHYVPAPEQRWQPEAAPLAADNWSGFPPTLVQTAELDPTRSDGDALACRLRDAGVEIKHTCYAGQIHGFQTAFDRVPGAAASLQEIAATLQVLGRSGQSWTM